MTDCIACRGEAVKTGEVPYSFHFLDQHFAAPIDSGDLYECLTCGLWFKHPYLPAKELASYYNSASDDLPWEGNEARPDFAGATAVLTDALPEGGRVLDLGCYRGRFLRSLGDGFIKFGIEPSSRAAEAASDAGIRIVGKDISALGDEVFDAITLFDVFEHLRDPLGTLDALVAHLRVDGILCVGTGFADSPLFRRTRAKHYYVCMPEHVCFLNEKFLQFLSQRYHSEYRVSILSRNVVSLHSSLRALAINLVELPMLLLGEKERIERWYSTPGLRVIASRGFQPVGSARDHALAVFRKGAAG